MTYRLATALSATALAVALLGSTPLGNAAMRAVLPLARFAQNSDKVNGIDASRTPKRGQLVALGARAKLPAGVVAPGTRGADGPSGDGGPKGVAGPAGAKGDTGDRGPVGDAGDAGPPGDAGTTGLSGWQEIPALVSADATQTKSGTATCPAGKSVVGGGYVLFGAGRDNVMPVADEGGGTGWFAGAIRYQGLASWGMQVIAVCATVAP